MASEHKKTDSEHVAIGQVEVIHDTNRLAINAFLSACMG